MPITQEDVKLAWTPPDSGLISVAPGIFVSTRSVEQILDELRKEGRFEAKAAGPSAWP